MDSISSNWSSTILAAHTDYSNLDFSRRMLAIYGGRMEVCAYDDQSTGTHFLTVSRTMNTLSQLLNAFPKTALLFEYAEG